MVLIEYHMSSYSMKVTNLKLLKSKYHYIHNMVENHKIFIIRPKL